MPWIARTADATGEPDVLSLAAEQWWAPVALFVVCMAVGLWMLRSLVLHRGRERAIARAARSSGMRHSEQDPYGLSRTGFMLFARGEGRGWTASHVVSEVGKDGLRASAFDARSWTEYDVVSDGDGGTKRVRRRASRDPSERHGTRRVYEGATRTAAVTDLPIFAPHTVIARENLLSKLVATATSLDLDVESELFNRSYHVMGSDREFARALLDARVVDVMVRTEGEIAFEFLGTKALLHTKQIEPELLPGLVRLAADLRAVIPRLVHDRWPAAASEDDQADLTATPR